MKIELNRLNDGYHLEAVNEDGRSVQMDASPDIGGTNQGMRPMQLLLAALGGCSSFDVISILRKQKQPVKDIKVTITGEREKGVTPAVFTEAHVHFRIYGDVDEDKARKAIDLGVDKYCSVGKTMGAYATITHSFEIIR